MDIEKKEIASSTWARLDVRQDCGGGGWLDWARKGKRGTFLNLSVLLTKPMVEETTEET